MPVVDLAMGRAALARTPSTHTCVTLSIEREFGAAPQSGKVVRCLGLHLLDDAGTTIATCEVRGADERLLAHGTGRFVSVRGGGEPRPVPGLAVGRARQPLRPLRPLERRVRWSMPSVLAAVSRTRSASSMAAPRPPWCSRSRGSD